jgi:hypothetical protein
MWLAPSDDPAFLSSVVVAAAAAVVVVLLTGGVRVVDGKMLAVVVASDAKLFKAARWRVTVWVRVRVLVEVCVDRSSARAASGRRSAVRRALRCILLMRSVLSLEDVFARS